MRLHGLAVLAASLPSLGCTVLSVGTEGDPPRIESDGWIDGHAAVGIARESHLLHLELFDGSSPGAIGELVLWKLFRLELGVAGAAITVGPLHLGLGVLAYDPRVPRMVEFGEEEEPARTEPAPEDTAGAAEASARR